MRKAWFMSKVFLRDHHNDNISPPNFCLLGNVFIFVIRMRFNDFLTHFHTS